MFQLAEHNATFYLFAIMIGFTVGGAIGMLYTSRWLRQLEKTNAKKIALGSGSFKYGIIGGACAGILTYCSVLIDQADKEAGLASAWIVVFTAISSICVLLFSALFILAFRYMNRKLAKTLQSEG